MRTISRTGFDFSFFRLFSKNLLPGKLHCTFFTRKVSTVILIEGVYALSRSKNDKASSIPRYDILAKIRRIMTLVHARALLGIEKISSSLSGVLVLDS